ncbi:hypothetical protein C8J98_106248 [Luteibacter sp. OK325]|nr:hypothetical protein C8J98_106248 [Luteibacter sp. OK325]
MDNNQADRPNRFDESMGAALGEVMHVLENKLVELQVVWLQYRQLFGTDIRATLYVICRHHWFPICQMRFTRKLGAR